MLRGRLFELTHNGVTESIKLGSHLAAAVPRRSAGMVALVNDEIRVWSSDELSHESEHLCDAKARRGSRWNEGAVSPSGELLIGSMAIGDDPRVGGLSLVGPSGELSQVCAASISNGLGWTADTRFAYYVDSPLRRIDLFDWSAEHGLHSRRRHVIVDSGAIPDGIAVDAEGGVWVALYGGGEVRRYDGDGDLSCVIKLPVRQVTSVAFWGEDRRRLAITTSRLGLADPEPYAGSVFSVDLPVPGVTVSGWVG